MKLKFDEKGTVVLQEVNGTKMPVYIRADGTEAPLDAAALIDSVETRAKQNSRVESQLAELKAKLKSYDGIDDPESARKALDMISKLDQKKLVEVGEIDRVRAEIAKGYEAKLGDATKERDSLREELYNERVGGAFSRSKVISEKFAVPPDMIQARFGENFGIDGGKLYAVDSNGNKLYSRVRPGELADFDEALTILVEQYPYRDQILKGTGSSGSGAPANGGQGAGGGRSISRAELLKMDPSEAAKLATNSAVSIVD